ncbi:MarR family winged helix-turn-helix transcriptional regulator [Candidatus Oscillochloris fontis]|uniref:MarR family winged helix-turn-helix transcriptional regulator n=1 Tax=Candidatus Oscillochloris fontis TaxID=2496868 RepID=UPI001EE79A27|nr:MarR family transcriptional regulator [Candidatus Oscillochloris fontis]
MSHLQQRAAFVSKISGVVRQITWQSQKQLLRTLSRPDIGLTMPQMVTLFAIRDAQMCRMSELADMTQQSAGTLTGIVDRLIEDHLVGRVRDVEDRRVVQVTLTPLGEERVARVERVHHKEMLRMLEHFDIGQLHDLDTMLRLLFDGLQQMCGDDTHPVTSLPSMLTPIQPV